MDNEIKDTAVFSPEAAQSVPLAAPEKKLSDSDVMQHTAGIWRYRTVIEDGTERVAYQKTVRKTEQ